MLLGPREAADPVAQARGRVAIADALSFQPFSTHPPVPTSGMPSVTAGRSPASTAQVVGLAVGAEVMTSWPALAVVAGHGNRPLVVTKASRAPRARSSRVRVSAKRRCSACWLSDPMIPTARSPRIIVAIAISTNVKPEPRPGRATQLRAGAGPGGVGHRGGQRSRASSDDLQAVVGGSRGAVGGGEDAGRAVGIDSGVQVLAGIG